MRGRNLFNRKANMSPPVLALVAVTFLACVAIGFFCGVADMERDFRVREQESEKRRQYIDGEFSKCRQEFDQKTETFRAESEEAAALHLIGKQISEEIENLKAGAAALHQQYDQCYQSLIDQKEAAQDQEEDFNDVKMMVEELEVEEGILRKSLIDLTDGHGMFAVLLFEKLKRLQARYEALCTSHQGCVLASDDVILEKWEDRLELAELINNSWMEQPASIYSNYNISSWQFDSSNKTEADNFFFPPTGDDAPVPMPTYFGRAGNSPVLIRDNFTDDGIEVSSAVTRLRVIQDYALCALRRNNSDFVFPNTFFWQSNTDNALTEADDLVNTPLIRFCLHCQMSYSHADFLNTCQGDIVSANYGNRDFWLMKSLLPMSPRLETSARHYIASLSDGEDQTPARVLAVVLHDTEESMKVCVQMSTNGNFHGPHFQYLKAAFSYERETGAADVDVSMRCSPTLELMSQRITEVLASEAAKNTQPFNAIYISAQPDTIRKLQSNSPPMWSGMIRNSAAPTSANDELLDLIIASYADVILVSSMFAPSQLVTELFLLRNQISPQNNVYFF